jgi:uncharacterized pyridoxamine 5'-phosphate oxidase family protein
MEQVVKFLNECGLFYLATAKEGQPYVRPFGAISVHNEKLYICTNNTKECFKQMAENPKVEISATLKTEWIRINGEVKVDPTKEAKQAMLDQNPSLKEMYSIEDGIFEVLYFEKGTATIYGFGKEAEEIYI